MKLQFDANQAFQIDAVAAVVGVFDGQPQGVPEFSVIRAKNSEGLLAGRERSELGLGNRLLLDEDRLRANARAVQARNDIDTPNEATPLEGWELFDEPAKAQDDRGRQGALRSAPSRCARSATCGSGSCR